MKLNIKTSFILLTALSAIVVSCLKDKDYDDGKIQSTRATGDIIKAVEIKLTAASTRNFLSIAVDNSNNDTIIELIPVNLATDAPASEDINVTLKAEPALVQKWNDDNHTDYVIPDPSKYTVVNANNIVTIPKGSNTGYLKIKFKPADYLVGAWAFGYTISSIDKAGYVISGNLKNGIVGLGAKNKYDGRYDFKGQVLRAGDPVLSGNFSGFTADLVTTGLNTSSFSQVWATGGGVGGIDGTTIQVDPTTNKVTMFSTTNPALKNWDLYPNGNRYDPATKTFYISFYWGNGPAHRSAIDTLTYIGPR